MNRRLGHRSEALSSKHSTGSLGEFSEMCRRYKRRTCVVSEGDSYFAYPPKWIVAGGSSNVISFLKKMEKFNFLEMARNGDEIVDILSGESKFDILKVISERPVDFLLISGGGNDLVASYDFEFLLRRNKNGKGAVDFIHKQRFDRKISQITNAYADLVDYCSEYSKNPGIKILTHCYGYAVPQDKPAQFVGGLIHPGPWMYPALKEYEIPEEHWRPIVVLLMDSLKNAFRSLQRQSMGRFHLIDTTTMIDDDDWIDEIHLIPAAFERVAKAFYAKMKELKISQ